MRCSGIWLDAGELATIRSQYKTESERQVAADKFVSTFREQAAQSYQQEVTRELEEEKRSFSYRVGALLQGLYKSG